MTNDTTPPQALNRRDFLKTSTVAASAAAIGTLDLSRSAHAAGSDIIKVGMIGCGGRNSGAAAQALSADPGARLVAMCDIFRDRVEDKLRGDQGTPRARRSRWTTRIASPGSTATST